MFDSVFAEVDIDSQALRQTELRQAQPIAPREPNPIRERFYEMRRLSTKRPFPKSDRELFYRQAKFMEDFTDDYEGNAAFHMYFPYYQKMGYDYLRTYFTWRTKARSGKLPPTSLSYVFLYIYELLSGIGVSDPVEGLSRLMDIWGVFSGKYPELCKYLPKWIRDYHVFYELPHSFSDFVVEYGFQRHYSQMLLFDEKVGDGERLSLWNASSGYDVIKSKFVGDGNFDVLAKCFDAVISALKSFCLTRGAPFEDMLVYGVTDAISWQPFRRALFGSDAPQVDREVRISKYERYFCKNGHWTFILPIYYSNQRDFIGYIIKKTEACLRDAVGYKYKLAGEISSGAGCFRELKHLVATRSEIDAVIERAVFEFWRDFNRVEVTVDHASLARIREAALETQGQLIVADEPFATFPAALGTARDAAQPPLTLSFADGWVALRDWLTDTEREALKLAQNGGDIKAFAAGKGIMLEVLFDGINEKAFDCIGDGIVGMEDDVYVFEEYRNNIKEVVY